VKNQLDIWKEPVCYTRCSRWRSFAFMYACSWTVHWSMALWKSSLNAMFTNTVLLYWRTAWWSIAVLTTWCQTSLSLAFLQAVWTPKFKD